MRLTRVALTERATIILLLLLSCIKFVHKPSKFNLLKPDGRLSFHNKAIKRMKES